VSFFPNIELFDRLAIAEVKLARIGNNQEEVDWYRQRVNEEEFNQVYAHFQTLKEIHNTIWDLEGLLKSGREQELGLEEIGRRAIEIRDWNNKRVVLKNKIADILATDNIREIKKDHLSE
jgi:hypothetical protein